jgi:predicted ribosome-associated RNA-binding protein Tma20
MFRKDKDIQERSQTLLKNKEIKQLKAELLKQFRYFEDHPEDLERFLPNKCDLTCMKLVNRTLLYSMNGTTLLFDVEGRNNLFPTVSTLSLYPSLLPCLSTWGPVSRFVMKGADFMIPGLAQSASWDETVQMNGKCALKIVGNPLPFAVGVSLINGSILNSQNQKGKAMLVYHNYGDFLTTKIPPLNAGFTLKEIKPIEGDLTAGEGEAYDDEDEGDKEEQGQDTQGITEELQNLEFTKPSGGDDKEETTKSGEVDLQTEELGDSKEEELKKSTLQYDEELMETLIITLKYFIKETKKEKQFPFLISTFWSLLQRCVKDDNMIIDIKKTSYRKVYTFLVDYCEKKLHLLETMEDANHNLFMISFNRDHELFSRYKVSDIDNFRMKVKQREQQSSSSSSTAVDDGHQKGVSGGVRSDKYVIMELYKIPKKIREIFVKDNLLLINGAENGEYYKANEIKELLIRYITLHRLENPEKRSTLLMTSDDDLYEFCSFDRKEKATGDSTSSSSSSSSSIVLKPSGFPPLKSENTAAPVPFERNGFSSVVSNSKETNYQNNFPSLASSAPPPKVPSGSSSDGSWRREPSKQPSAPLPPSAPLVSSQPKKKDSSSTTVMMNEEEIKINEISKEDFMKSILSKLTLYHGIIPPSTGAISIHSGTIPKIKILTEHRMGNKMVTVVRGLDYYQIDLSALSKQCQKK